MSDDSFTHEDRMRAGEACISALDALEDTDVQKCLIVARDALVSTCDVLRDRYDFDDRMIGLTLMGVVFAPMLDGGGQ
jgi:hypothetical protein